MAITEQDYLLLQDLNKAQVWMLLGSEKQFHLVRVDTSLTEQKFERLMKRYPCGMKTFQELGISATPLNRENCTHVILEGTEAGAKLTMYCAGTFLTVSRSNGASNQSRRGLMPGPPRLWDGR